MTKLQEFLNARIIEVAKMPRGAQAGDLFGVEIECEGRRVSWDGGDHNILKDWAPHADGSLRANHGDCCEWVFNGPVKYKQSIERINNLFDYFDKKNAVLVTSNRTSTHVHYNMGDKNVYQLVNMFILFTILEDLMDRYCGEHRNGNLFCLSSRHAEEQVRWVEQSCFKDYALRFREDWRYCSLNVAAINKFGTVEFRGMRGLDNREDVIAWMNILNEFCDYACYKMRNPVSVVEKISIQTPMGFLKEIFSKGNVTLLTKGLEDYEVNRSVYDGLRLVQMLCYRIGTEFDQVRLRGRDFWASFKDDSEPVRDIDPENFAGVKPRPFLQRPDRGARQALDLGQQVAHFGRLREAAGVRDAPPLEVWVAQWNDAAQIAPQQAPPIAVDPFAARDAAHARVANRPKFRAPVPEPIEDNEHDF